MMDALLIVFSTMLLAIVGFCGLGPAMLEFFDRWREYRRNCRTPAQRKHSRWCQWNAEVVRRRR
jgi:hypothetical protein